MNAQRSVGVYQPRSRRAQLAELFAGLRVRIYAFLGVALWRFAGGSLLVISGAMLLMIAGYDAADPSLDVATGKEVANWLGKTGAFGADLLLRFLGLSALALAANSCGLGLADDFERNASGATPVACRRRPIGSAAEFCRIGHIAGIRHLPRRSWWRSWQRNRAFAGGRGKGLVFEMAGAEREHPDGFCRSCSGALGFRHGHAGGLRANRNRCAAMAQCAPTSAGPRGRARCP